MTINKTSDLDNNTDTLKKLSSAADKPNNQTKLASISGTPLPPSHMKCNILKGKRSEHDENRINWQTKLNLCFTCSSCRGRGNNANQTNEPIVCEIGKQHQQFMQCKCAIERR